MSCDALMGSADQTSRRARLSLTVAGDAPVVWRALTFAAETPFWLGRIVGPPLSAGIEFALWHQEAVRSLHVVRQWVPHRVLEWTWDFPDESPSRVTFHLAGCGGTETVVTVEHHDLDEPVAYAAGWHRHLTYLAAHLAGQDLPWGAFWDGYDALVADYQATTHEVSDAAQADR